MQSKRQMVEAMDSKAAGKARREAECKAEGHRGPYYAGLNGRIGCQHCGWLVSKKEQRVRKLST